MAGHGNDGSNHRRNHRHDIGQDQSVARGVEGEGEGSDADGPRLYDRPRAHGCANIEPIGAGGERNVRPCYRDHDKCEQTVQAVDAAVGKHRLGESDEDSAADRGGDQCHQHRVSDDMAVWTLGLRQRSRQPALQPERRQLCDKFDNEHGIGEAAERVRTVPAPGDEKERETRGEPQQKTEHIRPAALCKRRNIILLRGGNLLSRQRKRVPLSRHILCCRMVNNK